MDIQDELGKLHTQLALCERLLVNLTESRMYQAIEDYALELEIKLSLLLSGIDALQANCVNPGKR
jgi:excinuclease UvrABC helicase subunit UvrB